MSIILPSSPKEFDKGRLSRAALQGFFNIAAKWRLKPEQQICLLGGIPRSTFYAWKEKLQANASLEISKDTLERISYILGIYKSLNILLPDEISANEWIHRPNSASLFNGDTALEKMLAGQVVDLADVRRYLDCERGG